MDGDRATDAEAPVAGTPPSVDDDGARACPAPDVDSGPPVAAGTRLPWSAAPDSVRAAVEAGLGSAVVEASSATGGFSPGIAARLRCADGATAFVKAISSAQNPRTPELHRAEARIAATLPSSAPSPRLRFVHDDGDWVALVYDAVDGATPTMPWSTADARQVMATVVHMGQLLTPCPVPDLPAVADSVSSDFMAWTRLAADPPDDLDPWERRHLSRLAAGSAALATAGCRIHDPLSGDTLLHLDLRADNVLLSPDGSVTVVDWPWASRGAAWIDPTVLGVDLLVYGGPDPEELLAEFGVLDDVDPEVVTALLTALTGMWAESYRAPPQPGMDSVRPFQRAFHDAALGWVRRRSGWE